MLAGSAYPLADQSMLCGLSVNRCSYANCLILRQPAMKGVSICSAAAAMLCVLVKIMPRYFKESLLASCVPPSVNTGTLVRQELKCTTSDLDMFTISPFLRA